MMTEIGAGIGDRQMGEAIHRLEDLKVGLLIAVVSDNGYLETVNLARVTKIDTEHGDRAYAIFVDPSASEKRRLPDDEEFVIWDFNLDVTDEYREIVT